MQHRHPGPRNRRGMKKKQRCRAAEPSRLKLTGEKQETLQGFLAPWVKAFEEWVSFAPSPLYLELKSQGTHLCKQEQKCQKIDALCWDTLKAQGSLLHPLDSQLSDHQFSGVSPFSLRCLVSPEKPSQKQGHGIPSHLQRHWRYQDITFMGIAFPCLSASPRSITVSCP